MAVDVAKLNQNRRIFFSWKASIRFCACIGTMNRGGAERRPPARRRGNRRGEQAVPEASAPLAVSRRARCFFKTLLQPCPRALYVERSASHENLLPDLPAGRHSIHIRARFGRAVGPPTDSEDCSAIEQSAAARRSARVQAGARSAQDRSAEQCHDQRGTSATSARRPGKGQTGDAEEDRRVREEERRKRFGLGAIRAGLASSHRRWS